MRNVNAIALSAADNVNTNGNLIDANQLAQASFHAVFSDATAAGTFKIQGSNDVAPARNMALIDGFAPTHWVDVPNQSASIVAGAQALLTLAPSPYRWLRAVYASSAAGVQTITTIADQSALAEVSRANPIADTGTFSHTIVTVPATAGAAQADYFVVSAPSGAKAAVWLDIDAAGTAPTGAAYVAAGTKIKASIVTGGTAVQNGTIIAAAMASILGYAAVDNGDGTVTLTESLMGPVVAPARHNAGDSGNGSFAFSSTVSGVASNLNSTYFILWSGNNAVKGVVWMNVNGEGIQPVVSGSPLYIPIAIPASETIANIASALLGVQSAGGGLLWNVNASPTQSIFYAQVTGPTTDIADGAVPTGFTFSVAVQGQNAGAHLLNSEYFFINDSIADGAAAYYVWFDTGTGVDPALAGKTGIQVVIAPGDSAANVSAALQAALAGSALAATAVDLTGAVQVTNTSGGPYTPASDHNTAFTFAITGGGSGTINVRMNGIGV